MDDVLVGIGISLAAGKTYKAIAAEFTLDINELHCLIDKHYPNYSIDKTLTSEVWMIRDLIKFGNTPADIASAYGCPADRVTKFVKRNIK